MGQKIRLDDVLLDVDNLSDQSKEKLALLEFATKREEELKNIKALLQRAKNSYVNSLKREMLSQKSGFIFSED